LQPTLRDREEQERRATERNIVNALISLPMRPGHVYVKVDRAR
jgi:hypothetical protein